MEVLTDQGLICADDNRTYSIQPIYYTRPYGVARIRIITFAFYDSIRVVLQTEQTYAVVVGPGRVVGEMNYINLHA